MVKSTMTETCSAVLGLRRNCSSIHTMQAAFVTFQNFTRGVARVRKPNKICPDVRYTQFIKVDNACNTWIKLYTIPMHVCNVWIKKYSSSLPRELCVQTMSQNRKKKLVSEEFTGFNWIWTGEDSLLQTYANPHSCRKHDRACSQSDGTTCDTVKLFTEDDIMVPPGSLFQFPINITQLKKKQNFNKFQQISHANLCLKNLWRRLTKSADKMENKYRGHFPPSKMWDPTFQLHH